MTNSNDIIYPLIFLVCYLSTMGFLAYVAYLISEWLKIRPKNPEKLPEEPIVEDK